MKDLSDKVADFQDFDKQPDWVKYIIEKENLYPQGHYDKNNKTIPTQVMLLINDNDPKLKEFPETANAKAFFIGLTFSESDGKPQIAIDCINSMKQLKRQVAMLKQLNSTKNKTIN